MKRILVILPFLLHAFLDSQSQEYTLRFESTKVRLYAGYNNRCYMPILHPGDTVTIYRFHASATGADIDYDDEGRLQVLPYQRFGFIDVYAEAKGHYYYAGRVKFEAIQPPPLTDGTFIEVMGITPDNPQNKLKNKKRFDPKARVIEQNPDIELGLTSIMELMQNETNEVKVKLFLKKDGYYHIEKGKIDLLSSDARIRKVKDNLFHIDPLPSKRRCLISYYLNGVKAGEESVYVRE